MVLEDNGEIMKKIKLVLLVVLVALLAVGCQQMKIEEVDGENQFEYVKDGGFYLNNMNVAVPVSQTENLKIMDWYTEPICPYCLTLEEETSSYLTEIQGDNTVIRVVPLTFLGRTGVENEVTYSDVITGIWLSMAENDPEMVGKYYHKVATEEYLNELQQQPNQNVFMQQTYEELGGEKWNKIIADLPVFMEVTTRSTEFSRRNKTLARKTHNGRLTTPTLYVQGEDMALNLDDGGDIRAKLEEALK